ncbi:MAG: CoA pyrophosphatase [Panacagrimonas sp.]|jgi:8-oxo-dGTP pyrophosphatase MutT (NUDIX family)|nr:CoA pyrophosphatase [Panacagrimonas sp.]MCC2656207.1 CoA pyrophosphatase [Panacagrimonas sp.]
MAPIEQRLREALSGTDDRAPRPITNLDLPLGADRWLANFMKGLRPAAVLAPVLRRGDAYSVMLTRRAEHLSSHKGQISFPGGRRDDTDVSVAANALREAQEEVGLDPARVEVLGYLDDYPVVSRYLVTPVVGLIDGDFTAQADPSEVAEVFELPLELALDRKAYARKSLTRDGLVVPYYELNWQNYRVWGATAGMLWNLCERVNAAR